VLDKPRSLLFQDGGENLSISLEDVGAGWRCKGSYQVSFVCCMYFAGEKKLCYDY